ncbi:hypothetical protein C8N24_0116 [Solirubrobacter pauli]|uniref:Thiamine pyrophosphate-dependent enzyme n=1 Tax=Solirubrobacter pauli TaxID=166793 RepID=A0A660L7T3_9ACTN|nr:hypothetical protein C8N24_0116 [Solirubrobacter pauli]
MTQPLEHAARRRTDTVRRRTYDLLRAHGMTTIFGNPGSTAFQNKTPLIVTAGQQRRDMLLLEPYLSNVDATALREVGVRADAPAGRPRGDRACDRRRAATGGRPGVLLPAARRLGRAGRRERRRADGRDPCRAGPRAARRVRGRRGAGGCAGPDPRCRRRALTGLGGGDHVGGGAPGARLDGAGLRTHAVPGGPSTLRGRAAVRDRPARRAAPRARPRPGRRCAGVPVLPVRARPVRARGDAPAAHLRRPGETARAPVGDSLVGDRRPRARRARRAPRPPPEHRTGGAAAPLASSRVPGWLTPWRADAGAGLRRDRRGPAAARGARGREPVQPPRAAGGVADHRAGHVQPGQVQAGDTGRVLECGRRREPGCPCWSSSCATGTTRS